MNNDVVVLYVMWFCNINGRKGSCGKIEISLNESGSVFMVKYFVANIGIIKNANENCLR